MSNANRIADIMNIFGADRKISYNILTRYFSEIIQVGMIQLDILKLFCHEGMNYEIYIFYGISMKII